MTSLLASLNVQVLFDAVADAMLLIDDAGTVIQANAAALQLFDYSEQAILNLKVEALIPPHYRQQHQQYQENFFAHPQKRSMGKGKNLLAFTRDGTSLPVDIALSPIQFEKRNFVLVAFHLTEKQAQAEERLRIAKVAVGLGIYDVDLQDGTVQADAQVRELLGLSGDTTLSYAQIENCVHPADRASRQAAIDHATRPGSDGEYSVEYRVNHQTEGFARWVSSAGQVFFRDGHAKRLLGVVRDVTKRKLLEQKLSTQRAEMESLMNLHVAIQTASAIAHELNQPLAAISAYSEVAIHALANETSQIDVLKLNRSLQGCVTQAQRAGQSLHELLQFLHGGEVAMAPIDLNEIVQEAIHITQHSGYIPFQQALDLEANLPKVLANHAQVEKVLVNLLRNGIEAAQGAGTCLGVIKVTVRTHQCATMAQVTVQDNGPGLDEEAARRVFEPFFTTKAKGIGMGLVISRALIEANGGQLWYDPDSSSGATFHFTLPFAP